MTKYTTPADDGITAARQEAMAHLRYNATTSAYYGYVGNDFVEVDARVFWETVADLTRTYMNEGMGMSEFKARHRAECELVNAGAWMSPHLDGVKINGMDYVETFQTRVAEFVREELITREPVPGKGIAVKYINEPLQKIAVAELDKQGK